MTDDSRTFDMYELELNGKPSTESLIYTSFKNIVELWIGIGIQCSAFWLSNQI